MLNNTFSGGLTSRGASATIDYLLDERVQEGKAYILEGNVQLTKQVIAECNNKWKWSSGVLSFSETLDKQTLEAIKEEWKTAFLCGMEADQTAPLFVVHTDKNRSEIHYVIPRVELSSNKAFNPYFVLRDKKKKTLFQEYINIKYNLTDPNDKGRESLTRGSQKNWTKLTTKKSLSKALDAELLPLIKDGSINSREGVIEYLRANGFELAANADTKKHLAIVNPNNPDKNMRLSGAIYQKDFDYSTIQNGNTPPPPKPPQEQQRRPIEVVKKELDYIIDKNTTYNKERYQYVRQNSITADRGNQQSIAQERGQFRELTNQTSTAINAHSQAERRDKGAERPNPYSPNERRGRTILSRNVRQFSRKIKQVHRGIKSNLEITSKRSKQRISGRAKSVAKIVKISPAYQRILAKRAREKSVTEQSTASKTAQAKQTPQQPKEAPKVDVIGDMLKRKAEREKQAPKITQEDISRAIEYNKKNPLPYEVQKKIEEKYAIKPSKDMTDGYTHNKRGSSSGYGVDVQNDSKGQGHSR